MPELPEVEVTRLSLAGRLTGARIEAVQLGKPLRWPLGASAAMLVGAEIGPMLRRGKYLWLPLLRPGAGPVGPAGVDVRPDQASADSPGLLIHLGMSGALRFETVMPPAGVHDHFDCRTDRGLLRLHDPRRFGAVVWSPGLDCDPAARLLARLGVEPFGPEFTPQRLHAGLRGRSVSIKQALLAGNLVVGVGNIYCSEALFVAGIDPRTPAGRIGPARCARLVDAVRSVLGRAVEVGGSTLRDFHDASGHAGGFQDEAQVYGRAQQPCRRCGASIRRIVQGQRATYFCPGCQH